MVVSMANKVRLWCAGVCQVIGTIIMLATPTPDGNHVIYISTQNGLIYEAWAGLFLSAATVLASITLYNFVKNDETKVEGK